MGNSKASKWKKINFAEIYDVFLVVGFTEMIVRVEGVEENVKQNIDFNCNLKLHYENFNLRGELRREVCSRGKFSFDENS